MKAMYLMNKSIIKLFLTESKTGTYLVAGALIGRKLIIKKIETKIFKSEIKILKKWV